MNKQHDIYVFGDIHAEVGRLVAALDTLEPGEDDVALLVGDLGLNFDHRRKFGKTLQEHVRSVEQVIDGMTRRFGIEQIAWVPGNHDHPTALAHLPGYTDGRLTTFPSGLKVWGCGGAVGEFRFPYEPTETQMDRQLRYAPRADVLLCHQPPMAMRLAMCVNGQGAGSASIRQYLENDFLGSICVCGHIHEAWGIEPLDASDGRTVSCMNAGSFGTPHFGMRYGRFEVQIEKDDVVKVLAEEMVDLG